MGTTLDRMVKRLQDKSGLEDRYFAPHKLPKWNITPSILQADKPALTRQVFSELSKTEHEKKAVHFAEEWKKVKIQYDRAVDVALKKYGVKGPWISGAGQDHFPEQVKNKLRALARTVSSLSSASYAHWKASGKRTPWPFG